VSWFIVVLSAVVANVGTAATTLFAVFAAVLTVITNLLTLLATLLAGTGVPPTLDPDVATTAAALPATGRVDIADALAFVVAVVPDPLTTTPVPPAFDPDVTWTGFVVDHARRRRFGLHLDDRDRRTTDVCAATAAHHAASEEHCETKASEQILSIHSFLLESLKTRANAGPFTLREISLVYTNTVKHCPRDVHATAEYALRFRWATNRHALVTKVRGSDWRRLE
jgi:hypothetical protein